MIQNKFAFFANFAETIRATIPVEKQATAYQAICEFGIYGTLPEDPMLKMMCLMAKASIFNKGGAPEGNQNAKKQPKNNLKTTENNPKTTENNPISETETETETETRKEKQETEVETETETETETEKKENTKEKYDALFAEFWSVYPKQRAGSKEKALKAYIKAIDERKAEPPQILNACKCYAESREVLEGYAKGCAAWLNDDRYLCDYGQNQVKTENGDFYVEW